MPNQTAIIYDPLFLKHETDGSPECPERLTVILEELHKDRKFWESMLHLPPRLATEEDILRCHSPEHLKLIQTRTPLDEDYAMLDPDTIISKDSYYVALLAAGAGLTAIDAIFAGEITNAFALIRPPGHHATINEAMGFCLFNNAAIAARYAQTKHHVKNILIIDWDVHHGNGTQDIFYNDPCVFYFSTHEFPFYPGTGSQSETGSGAAKGTTLNIPLPAGTSAKTQRDAFSRGLQHIQKIFKPDFIIISAGFDSRQGDPLGQLQLSEKDFAEMTQEVMQMANTSCEGKLLSLLEGGYVNATLGEVVKAHITALLA